VLDDEQHRITDNAIAGFYASNTVETLIVMPVI